MIKKRIIPKILLNESLKTGRIYSGTSVKYHDFKVVGDPESQSEIFQDTISDELMVLSTRLSNIDFQKVLQTLDKICNQALMPVSYGGSITDIEQINKIFDIGVERVIFGRSLRSFPKVVEETANRFGSQAVVASIDYLENSANSIPKLGQILIRHDLSLTNELTWVESLGAGEICLSDVNSDGTMKGSNLRILQQARENTALPIIQNCGIGKTSHFVEAFKLGAEAVAVGSYFAFLDQNFIEIRSHIKNSGINIRL